MEQSMLQNMELTEGEYGSILEVLYYSIEGCRYELAENDSFEKIDDFVTLNSIRKRFLTNDYLEKGLFIYPFEIQCLVKYINQFLNTVVDEETIKELDSIKRKLKDLIHELVRPIGGYQEGPLMKESIV